MKKPVVPIVAEDDVYLLMAIPHTIDQDTLAVFEDNFMAEEIFPPYSLASGAEFEQFPPEQLRSFKLIRGAIPFGSFTEGVYANITPNPLRVTFLHHPVQRTILAYQYHQENNLIPPDFSLMNFLTDDTYQDQVSNVQTHWLAGFVELDGKFQERAGEISDTVKLHLAKEVIDYSIYVGIVDAPTQSRLLFQYKFRIKLPNANFRFGRVIRVSDYDKEAIQEIRKRNQLDWELYQYAKKRTLREYQEMAEELVIRYLET